MVLGGFRSFHVLVTTDLSVIFAVLLWFIAGYFYRIISVILLLQPFFFVNVGVYPGLPLLVFPLWDVESVLEWRDRLSKVYSITPGKRAEKTWRRGSRREASNAKSGKSLFHFKPEKVNKFEYCNNLWKQNIFRNPRRKLDARCFSKFHAVCARCMQIFM